MTTVPGCSSRAAQNLKGLALQPDFQAALAEHTFLQVNLEGSEVNDAIVWRRRLHGA